MKKRNNLLRKMLALMLAVMICCTMLILPASAKGNPAAEAAKAVVRVVAVDPVYNVVVSYGSAFGIGEKADEAPEYFITNWHVAHTDTPIPVEGSADTVAAAIGEEFLI